MVLKALKASRKSAALKRTVLPSTLFKPGMRRALSAAEAVVKRTLSSTFSSNRKGRQSDCRERALRAPS